MLDDRRITQEDIDRVQIRLKSFLGIQPKRWLAALYGSCVVVLFFITLVLPGIRKNGSMLSVDSRPRGSAIFVDGAYAGATPCRMFVARGIHLITVSRPSFVADERELRVGGRIVGSLLFPRRQSFEASLKPRDPMAFIRESYAEYAGWALAGRPSATYQYPLVLSESLLALSETGFASALPRDKVPSFDAAALAAAPGEHAARDALRAAFIAAAGGAPSPLGLVAGLESLEAAVGTNPALMPWIESILPPAAEDRLAGMDGTAALRMKTALLASRIDTSPAASGAPLLVAGLGFRPVPAGEIVAKGETQEGTSLPYRAELPFFYLAETAVTRRQWRSFIDAAPDWSGSNRAALIAAHKADDSYLSGWDDAAASPELPVTGVSWEAARAYCGWLGTKAPAGFKAVLPSEDMYERAVRAGGAVTSKAVLYAADRRGPAPVGSVGRDRLGFADLLGNVWEWCSDAYVPAPALENGDSEWEGPERSVRGGCWADRPGTLSASSRGSFPPSFTSPFLGFRPALVRE